LWRIIVANISILKRLIGLLSAPFFALTLSGCQNTPLPESCATKPESGRCRAAIERYYFDPQWQECRAFIWGGCEGVVPFDSMESCQSTCPSLSNGQPTDAADKPNGSSSTHIQKLSH
jgi:trypsin inhibitor